MKWHKVGRNEYDDDDDDDDVISQPHYPPYWTYMSVKHVRGNFLNMHWKIRLTGIDPHDLNWKIWGMFGLS